MDSETSQKVRQILIDYKIERNFTMELKGLLFKCPSYTEVLETVRLEY